MTIDDILEFRPFLRQIFASWPDLFISDEFQAQWWEGLRRFELDDIRTGLMALACDDERPPPLARARKQIAMVEAKRHREERHQLEHAQDAEQWEGGTGADGEVVLELSGCPIRDKATRRFSSLAEDFRQQGMSPMQAQVQAFDRYVREIAQEKSLPKTTCDK